MVNGINRCVNVAIGVVVLVALFFCLKPNPKPTIELSTEEYFQSTVTNDTRPVLVQFGASWSPPCVSTDGALMEYESQSNGEVKVIIIDVDTNGRLTQQYGVRVIPHSFLLLNGEVIDDRIGSMDGDDLKKWLESNESSWKKPRIVAALD